MYTSRRRPSTDPERAEVAEGLVRDGEGRLKGGADGAQRAEVVERVDSGQSGADGHHRPAVTDEERAEGLGDQVDREERQKGRRHEEGRAARAQALQVAPHDPRQATLETHDDATTKTDGRKDRES